jgi:hypothetical protein
MTNPVVNFSPFAGAGAQFFDNNGIPLAGGLLYSYASGTTTPQATYTTPAADVANANPIVLDAAGRTTNEIWLSNGYAYKFVLKNSSSSQIGSYDNIPSTSTNLAIINDASSVAYEQGNSTNAGSFVVGKTYLITFVGTTAFTSIGATSNTVGIYFTATGVGSGTGTAQLSRTVQAKLQEYVSVKDFGAVGDGSTNDTAAIQACLNSGATTITFPPGTYLVTSTLTVPGSITIYFNQTVIQGHFSNYLMKLLAAGAQTFIGELQLQDSTNITSSSSVITSGITFGDDSTNAVHNVNTVACNITGSRLLTAFYFGYNCYTNSFGSLSAYTCGNATTGAVIFSASTGANNIYINKLEIIGIESSSWNGKGLIVNAGLGITIDQLHLEAIYNTTGAVFSDCSVSVLGGYLESTAATATSTQITVNSTATVNFTGVLFNIPSIVLNTRTNFIGCRFLNIVGLNYANYLNCRFPNANYISYNLTNASATFDSLPKFGAAPTMIYPLTHSGNFSEWNTGYTSVPIDYNYYGGNHTLVSNVGGYFSNNYLTFTSSVAGYAGGVGFALPSNFANQVGYFWAIVQLPTGNTSMNQITVGTGGLVGAGTGNYYPDSQNIYVAQAGWSLIVMPNVRFWTQSGTYSDQVYCFFEAQGTSAIGDYFRIGAFGAEIGGLSYGSYGIQGNPISYLYRKATAVPSTGTWTVGDQFINSVPTVGQPKGWVCTVAGTPGTWTSLGNL